MSSYSPTYTADVSVASVSELITEMNNATASTIIDASNSDNNGLVPADTVIDGSGCLVFTNTGKNALLRCEESNVEIRNATIIGANGDTFGPYSENSAIWIYNSDVLVENVRCRNWQGAGISVGHTSDTNRYTPTITGCDLIDNRSSGYGYGLAVYSGFPEISNCYFNGNKHQIACSGESNAGYEVYDSYFGDHYNIFGCDMHDPGGEKFLIHHNTFEFAHNKDREIRHNVVMRGESNEVSEVHHNWFHNPNAPPDSGDETGSVGDGSAIRQDTDSDTFVNLDVYDNHFGSDEPSDSTIGQRTGSDTRIQWGSHFDWNEAQTHDRVVTSDIGVQRSDDVAQGWDIVDGIASDAVTYWTMDESSGDLIDVAGSLNATVYGATYGVTGPLRTNALSFDGTDDYATANSSGDPTRGGSFSIMAWVNKETVDNIDTILRSGTTTAGTFFFDYRSDTRMGCGFYDSSENPHYSTTFHDGTTLAGTQHLVIATFDESAGEITVYLDGTADTYSTSATRPECTETLQIGRSAVDNNPRYMTGDMGVIVVWARALSSTEATTLTDALSSGTLTTPAKSGDGKASSVAIDCEVPSAIAGEATATVHNTNVESETVTLTEGYNEYSLSNFTAINGDFWIDYDLSSSDETTSAEVYHSDLTLTGSSLSPLGTVPMEVAGTSYTVPVYDRTELENSGRTTGPGGTASNGSVGAFKLINPSESKFHCTVNGTIYGIALSDDGGGGSSSETVSPVGSPVHWWPMDEGSGTTITDGFGGVDATTHGTVWYSDTWMGGYSLHGEGTDEYVDAGTPTVTGQFAVCWTMVHHFENGTVDERQDPLSGGWDGSNNLVPWQVYFDPNNDTLYADSWDGSDTSPSVSTAITNLAGPGTKQRVVLQYDGSDWQLWVDGMLVSSAAGSYGAVDASTSRYLFAIDDDGTPNHFFEGTLDDVVIYDTSLTDTEISDDYARQPWT